MSNAKRRCHRWCRRQGSSPCPRRWRSVKRKVEVERLCPPIALGRRRDGVARISAAVSRPPPPEGGQNRSCTLLPNLLPNAV
jgi:hypothetical protein